MLEDVKLFREGDVQIPDGFSREMSDFEVASDAGTVLVHVLR